MSPTSPGARALLMRLRVPLFALVFTHIVGTAGYHVLWHGQGTTWFDALYMTFITVTTIGFAEIRPLGTAGRLLTMFVAASGIGSLFFSFTVLLDYASSDETRAARRRKKMQHAIDKLEGHYIVAGIGRVGREAALELLAAKSAIVAIDPGDEARRLGDEKGCLFLQGDATDDGVLERAGVKRARGLIVTTDSDATNLYVIMSARLMNPELFIAARAADMASKPKLLRAGANRVISPYAIGGHRLAHLMLSPRVVDFFETALRRGSKALNIDDILVEVGSPAAGKSLEGLRVRAATGATILAVLRDGTPQPNPSGDFRLAPGDHLLVLGTDDQLQKLEHLLNR